MDTVPAACRPPRIGLVRLFLKFLKFGCLAFGGPVAQIAMLRQALVEEERWIDRARFNNLLAVLQLLPGPEAHELSVHLGMLARGRPGGLLAGLGFMLPGLCLMLFVGWAYVGWIQHAAWLAGALLGVQVAIMGVILRAVIRIGQHVIEDRLLAAIAVGALAATIAGVPFWIPLLVGGTVYAARARPAIVATGLAIGLAASIAAWAIRAGGEPASTGHPLTILALFIAGLKGGLLTFGGAYTAIPYVRADTVGRGWISDAAFLDGVAFANVLPAPLVIFATFAGYIAGGLSGALAMTAGMFLPAFSFSLILFERLEAIVEAPSLQRLLTGVAAAVVGIIAGTVAQLTIATSVRVTHLGVGAAIFGVAVVWAWRVKGGWVTPAIVVFGAVVGQILLSQG